MGGGGTRPAKLVRASTVLPWRLVTPGLGCVNASPPNVSSSAPLRCHGRLVSKGSATSPAPLFFSVQSGQQLSLFPGGVAYAWLCSDYLYSQFNFPLYRSPRAECDASTENGRKAVQPRRPSRLVENHKECGQAKNGIDK